LIKLYKHLDALTYIRERMTVSTDDMGKRKPREVAGILLKLLLIGILTLAFTLQPGESESTTWTVDDDGPADFHTIQEAINAASLGDTIYVHNGTYYEQVVVNKSVSLVGDKIAKPTIITTGTPPPIINGSKSSVHISANNVTVTSFEIQNLIDDWGIFLNHSSNSIANDNTVKAVLAIFVDGGSGNNISDNEVADLGYSCVFHGLELRNSEDNVVTGNYLGEYCHNAFIASNAHHNYVAFNFVAGHMVNTFTLTQCNNNLVVGNTIRCGGLAGSSAVFIQGSNSNVLYHNNFNADAGGTLTVSAHSAFNNTWDNGYPSGGNYWNDYAGNDSYSGPHQNETGSDGIGDTAYTIDENNQDNFPLMNPWTPPDYMPPQIFVLSPRNTTYATTPVPLTFTVNEPTSWIGYSLDGQANITVLGNTTLTGLSEGMHNVIVYANDTSGNQGLSTKIYFTYTREIPIKEGENATIESNVTVTDATATANALHFHASGPSGSTGWINVTFPKVNTTEITVFVNNFKLTPPPFPIITGNETHYFVHFEFTLSTHDITILYEMPVGGISIPVNKLELLAPYIGLTILLAVAVVAVVYVKKRKRK